MVVLAKQSNFTIDLNLIVLMDFVPKHVYVTDPYCIWLFICYNHVEFHNTVAQKIPNFPSEMSKGLAWQGLSFTGLETLHSENFQ